MSHLSLEMMLETMRKVQAMPCVQPQLRIIVSNYALKETDERLFKKSRYRSARIRKKLIKRFGGEFRKVPCIFRTPEAIICHPARYAELKAQAAALEARS